MAFIFLHNKSQNELFSHHKSDIIPSRKRKPEDLRFVADDLTPVWVLFIIPIT